MGVTIIAQHNGCARGVLPSRKNFDKLKLIQMP